MGRYYMCRPLCEVLEEMRTCLKTMNFSYLPGLIEEAQTMANRMENGLQQQKDLREIDRDWHREKAKLKEIQKLVEAKAEETGIDLSDIEKQLSKGEDDG